MNIERVASVNEINNYNKVNKVSKTNEVVEIKDSIEISKEGKLLNIYACEPLEDKSAKVQELKEKIANGTYNIDSKQMAKSIIKAMN